MSVLIFIDQSEGKIKKSAFEAMSYGAAIAKTLGVSAEGVFLGNASDDLATAGNYGVSKVYHVADAALNTVDAGVYTKVIAQIAQKANAQVIVFSQNQTGKSIASAVSAQLKAGLVAGACALPEIDANGFIVKKTVFSGKAFAKVKISSTVKVISINVNSYTVNKIEGTAAVETVAVALSTSKVKLVTVNKLDGELPLTEAEIVVSGGRGLKGPEHWDVLLNLAKTLNAATACSRPVADAHWRPHHEHVGQTGVQIAPNLYIAVGISGAIQHLAGVNRSKVIVVINKDPEAPFFKAADYGIVGDAFEVLPKLTDAIQKLHA